MIKSVTVIIYQWHMHPPKRSGDENFSTADPASKSLGDIGSFDNENELRALAKNKVPRLSYSLVGSDFSQDFYQFDVAKNRWIVINGERNHFIY